MSESVAGSMPMTLRPLGTRGRIRRGMASSGKPITGDGARHAGRHTSPDEMRKNQYSTPADNGPGTSISAVARRHGLSASQLFTWRRLVRHAG
ncbi:transposase [Methylobacterium sp. J-030]|uniref:transposase n=1 Tax=Methylobacterium sp. J-030 TaxID=2836627 RepID=UPI00391D86EB